MPVHHLIIVWALLFFTLLSVEALAQSDTFRFTHFTTRNGLSRNYIKTVLQDHRGYLWLGTNDGLNRYDGYGFKIYQADQATITGISDNYIQFVFEDSKKRLWVGTKDGGVQLYQEEMDRFIQPACQGTGPYYNALAMVETPDQRIWLGTSLGIFLWDETKETFDIAYRPSSVELPFGLRTLYVDAKGTFWVAMNMGLFRFESHKSQLYPVPVPLGVFKEVNAICQATNDTLWFGTNGQGLFQAILQEGALKIHKRFYHEPGNPHTLGGDIILSLLVDRSGDLWIGTDLGGLALLRKDKQPLEVYRNDQGVEYGLSSNNIMTLHEDRKGNIWIGTNFGGLNLLEKNAIFRRYKSDPNFFNSNPVLAIWPDVRKNLWIGTDGGGLSVYPSGGKAFQRYQEGCQGVSCFFGNTVQTILEDRNGYLWTGTYQHGVNRLHPDRRKIDHFFYDGDELARDVRAIIEDSRGQVWIATKNGLYLHQGEKKPIVHYQHNAGKRGSIPGNSLVTVFEDSRHRFWIGTYGQGASWFMPGSAPEGEEFFEKLGFGQAEHFGLTSDSVSNFVEDQAGNIWIGTFNGLNKADGSLKKMKHYSRAEGLPGNIILGMLPASDTSLWISTDRGLVRYLPGPDVFQPIHIPAVHQVGEFMLGAAYRDQQGYMYFGGVNGLLVFHPDSLVNRNQQIPLHIQGFTLFNQPVIPGGADSPLQQHINFANQVTLLHDQNVFTFHFSAVDYPSGGSYQYAVMLEGFDKGWRYIGTDRSATYTNLQPGHYAFRVQAINSEGVAIERPEPVRVTVLPPFWRTPAAYAAYVVTMIVILLTAINLTVKRTRLKERLKLLETEKQYDQKVYQAKLKFFTQISHEFRTPLTLMLLSLEKLMPAEGKAHNPHLALLYRNTARLLRLVNQVMDFRKVVEGKMQIQLQTIDLIPFVEKTLATFEPLAWQKQITLRIDAGTEPVMMMADPGQLEHILYNLLSNALRFTPTGGRVEVGIEQEQQGWVVLRVEDTGIGISPEEQSRIFEQFYQVSQSQNQGTGIGLALVKELVELHGGHINLKSQVGEGSVFFVHLPVGNITHALEGSPVHIDSLFVEPPIPLAKGAIPMLPDTAEKPLLLVVEDHDELRAMLKDNLEPMFAVATASNGEEALAFIHEHLPDLVLSDIMMPMMDGLTLCRKIKEDIKTAYISVILLTARTTEGQKMEGILYGADDYITKPFSMALLSSKLYNIVETRKALRRSFMEGLGPETTGKIQGEALGQAPGKNADPWYTEFVAIAERHLADPEFRLESFCKEVGMSQTQLYHKVKEVTGMSPHEFIRDYRLKRAAILLEEGKYTVSEVTILTGFNDPKYFSRSFRKIFGASPSEYGKQKSAG
jgi:signal transduction histidine kinase/ligand-binding sensor domain-containing protein/CheY-like chemotaxis protein/AraC-like DNA-binding protein